VSEVIAWWQAVLLGIVQGLTEFLPVSSSGHLALAETYLAVPGGGVALAVLLHAGTLLAIGIVFRSGVLELLRGALALPGCLARPPAAWPLPSLRAAQVAVATVPGGLVGLFLEERIEVAFASPTIVGVLLLVTGGFLFATRRVRPGDADVGWRTAFLVGCAQAFAILPGISRSGATITAAILLGIARPRAAEFSFLAAIPLILGSVVLKLPDLAAASDAGATIPLAAGFLTSFLVGWAALVWLVRLVRQGRLHWFAPYCWLVGAAALAVSLGGI
jgi:undecaprenyl-diphosphatase